MRFRTATYFPFLLFAYTNVRQCAVKFIVLDYKKTQFASSSIFILPLQTRISNLWSRYFLPLRHPFRGLY